MDLSVLLFACLLLASRFGIDCEDILRIVVSVQGSQGVINES